MELRPYAPADCAAMAELFYNTVHTVNARDYTPEQLCAWATGEVDLAEWDRSFQAHHTLVAVEGEQIVGFGDLDVERGYRVLREQQVERRGVWLTNYVMGKK